MNAHASILRDFGLRPDDAPRRAAPPTEDLELILARARGQARADGYARGLEEAEAGFDREILLRLDATTAALERLAADREGARAEVAETVRRILTAFLEAVSPRLAEINLLPEIVAAAEDAAAAAPDDRVVIEAPPDMAAAVAERLARLDHCEVAACDALAPSEARVSWRGGFDRIDARPAIDRALAILDAHLAQPPAAPAEEEDR